MKYSTVYTGTNNPALNFLPGRGSRVAIAFDDEAPQILPLAPASHRA